MFRGKKVVVVMPAYNAAKTLVQTFDEVMAEDIVDKVIVVDDASRDETTAIARSLPDTIVFTHEKNLGYGGNQKSCYRLALAEGADIVIMVHPDYQYTPKLIPAMTSMIASGLYPCVLGSRILGNYALQGGMPLWKYVANRFLTLAENILFRRKAFGIPYRHIAPFRVRSLNASRCRPIRTILCLIIKCSLRSFGSITRLQR